MNDKEQIKIHFDTMAGDYDRWKKKNEYYHSLLKDFFRKNIPAGSSIIEFGCGTGDILASCNPRRGVGVDLSESLIEIAKKKYPQYEFKTADVERYSSEEKFDYCIMCDLIDHLSDIPSAIESAYNVLKPQGKLLITTINPLYDPLFGILESLKLKMPEGPHCFVPNRFLEFFCSMKGFKAISKGSLIAIPKNIILISNFLNYLVPRIPFLNRLCWVQTLVVQKAEQPKKEFSCTVFIPVCNEEKNIEECVRRIPKLNRDYEILVVDDGSRDSTPEILKGLQSQISNLKVVTFPQNRGKAFAVEEAIRSSSKDIVIILDADMAVAPEDIPLFLEPLDRGLVDFVNGTRLIYAMEKSAMEQIKRISNFMLALMFSAIIKNRITDTLCGTKAFFKKDFLGIKLSAERWGDLVLLGTTKEKRLRVGEVPIRYYTRKSGESKMRFFSDGMRFMGYTLKIGLKGLLRPGLK